MVTIKHKGDFKKLDRWFNKSVKVTKVNDVTLFAETCVQRLKEATPKNSGLTANSWGYEIIKIKNRTSVNIYNTNIQNGTKIVLLLEFGHATVDGKWIEGKNFIDPIIRETYNGIVNKTWKDVKNL